MKRKCVTLIGIVCMGMILTAPAFSSMAHVTLYESLQRTDFIVVGTITKKKIESDKTYNYLKVNRVIYGRLDKSTVPILTWGGSSRGVSHEASYDEGKSYLVFLALEDWYHPKGMYYRTVLNVPSDSARFEMVFNRVLEAVQPLLEIKNEPNRQKRIQQFLKLLQSENYFLLESAIIEIKKGRVQQAIPDLIRLLQTGEPQIRFHSIDALRDIGGEQAIVAIRSALRDPSPIVRSRAVQALGWMKDYASEDDLINLFRDQTEDPYVRRCAAMELGVFPSTKALPYLEKVLNEERKDLSSIFQEDIMRAIERLKTFQNNRRKRE